VKEEFMLGDSEKLHPPSLPKDATAAALTGLSGVTFLTEPEKVFGANDRVRVAICGLRGQGFYHVEEYAQIPNVEIAAFCDPDENILSGRLADIARMALPQPQTYTDVRKLLEDKSIDCVSIATPNHWHSLIGIWACQAGKDVYVEKPCSHNWWDSHQLVRAARKYNRLVQHGVNMRSSDCIGEAVEKLREGVIGDVYMARGLCYNWRDTIGHTPVEAVPAGVNYDLWTGPAPLKPFTRNRFHYNWHWLWDFGNGDLGNQGIHELDVARWGLGVAFPHRVSAMGGHFLFDDDQETPNTLNCVWEFDLPDGKRKLLEFEVRHWITHHEAELRTPGFGLEIPGFLGRPRPGRPERLFTGGTVGDIFYGSQGYMATTDAGPLQTYRTRLGEEQEFGPTATHGSGNCWANFIECVRSRKKENLQSPIEEGHITATLVHLANASYRLGRMLKFDPATEQVVGDAEASRLLRGAYREPFVVPEEV
jgi:predicted dehydrogenase